MCCAARKGRKAGWQAIGRTQAVNESFGGRAFKLPFTQPQFTAAAACVSKCLTCSLPACWACDHVSINSFPERGYQGQCWDGPALALIPSISILDCLHRHTSLATLHTQRPCPSFSGDITVEGLDGERPLQTGEVVIIVVVLLMWAGE